eukprot:gene21754-28776_t
MNLGSASMLLLATLLGMLVVGSQATLSEWCSLGNHSLSEACSQRSFCQSTDNWWGDANVCVIPGFLGGYPANYDSYQVCGGYKSIQTKPISDQEGNQYGTMYMFRDYSDKLYITVTLDGSKDGQMFFQVPNSGAPLSSSLFLWDGPTVSPTVQYPAPVNLGRFTCFTYSIDLKHVCDPFTSFYRYSTMGDNYNCVCHDTTKPCPTKDLSDERLLFFLLQVNLTQRTDITKTQSCGQPSGNHKIVGSYFSSGGTFFGAVDTRELIQADSCVTLIISSIPFFTGRASSFTCDVTSRVPSPSISAVQYQLNFFADFSASFFGQAVNEYFWLNSMSSLQVGCGGYATYESSEYESSFHICTSNNQFKDCKFTFPQMASAVLANIEDVRTFMKSASSPDNAQRIAKSNQFTLGCGDSILFDATPCGGPEARVAWDQVSLPYLACNPPPANAPPA